MPTLNRRADRLLNDSLQLIDAAGERSSKSQELALVAQNAWSPDRFVYRCERLDICDGRLAIVVGTGIAEN